jgi:hypothetical protein
MELSIIQHKIYDIRGYKVMLDFDLAEMYATETRVLKQSVRRNIERFPSDFMFELTQDEYNSLKTQIVTLENKKTLQTSTDGQRLRSQIVTSNRGGMRYMPFAFTEQGVAMLSSVLNNKLAISINISIMRAFVAIRQFMLNPPPSENQLLKHELHKLKEYIEEVFTDYNDLHEDTRMQLELINETLAELQIQNKTFNKPRNPVGFAVPTTNAH